MTENTSDQIQSKLLFLEERLKELARFRSLSRETYDADSRNRYTVERLLQTAIEAAIDTARLMVIEKQLTQHDDPDRSVFESLAEAAVIPSVLAERLRQANGLRNILVHEYARIDPTKVHEHLQNDLGDLKEFSKAIAAYLTREP